MWLDGACFDAYFLFMTFIDSKWNIVRAAVSGRAHQRARRGSQDAVSVRMLARPEGAVVVAVVCDGCSAGESSEVGAGLGARFVAADVARRLAAGPSRDCVDDLADAAIDALVTELDRASRSWCIDGSDADERAALIASCLLFTVQVAVIGPARFVVFGVGDGVVRVNGVDVDVAVNDDGAPDCPAYRLIDGLHDHAKLTVHAHGATADLRSLTIATDGALELARAASTTLPTGEAFGGLALFESDARFVLNPSLATKRLTALGAAAPEDDCTVVVVRRALPASFSIAADVVTSAEPSCA